MGQKRLFSGYDFCGLRRYINEVSSGGIGTIHSLLLFETKKQPV